MEGTQQSAIQSFGALFLVITCNCVHASLSEAPGTFEYGQVHPNDPKEIAQLDFLVGDYQVTDASVDRQAMVLSATWRDRAMEWRSSMSGFTLIPLRSLTNV